MSRPQRTVNIPKHWIMPANVDTGWRERATCRGVITDGTVRDDEVIFPFSKKTDPDPTKDFREIMCGPCPVRSECLGFALTMGYTGVWGGFNLTDADLREYRRRAAVNALDMTSVVA